ncbi:MAG TPA: NAD+ synthase [Gaiellaceae bacterium]|jgi:NAD+ synthase (glutamine-hydrolysing)|nr:NAD+ synthase [Gaiellaceae bacterium]
MRLALAQINSVVGDIDANAARVVDWLEQARAASADLVLFPELVVTGYPPEDLLLRPGFVRAARHAVDGIAKATRGITVLVGAPHLDADLYNACFVLAHGEVRCVYRKRYLPNYGVFDEDRYFAPGNDLFLLRFGDVRIGPTICEDIWQPGPPATDLALGGAQLIANISASPFHVGKDREREEMLRVRALDNSCFVALCNAVGGQDELIFDGHSVVLDDEGEVLARAAGFEEELLVVDVDPAAAVGRRLRDLRRRALARERVTVELTEIEFAPPREQQAAIPTRIVAQLDDLEQMRLALELGLRDYVTKNGFGDVVLGLSGGIDSALTAALCVEALGAERVHGVSMPSRYSSDATRGDAVRLADSLGIDFREIAIEPMVEAYTGALHEQFAGRDSDLTEENLQARIRGTLLMALSNKFGWLVIATGNKSELSVGYSTLYGDLAGGFALIKDVYKTDVFRLSRWLNERAGRELIPSSIIERSPSAELRADQLDEDSLPPYPALDRVLEAYVELDRSREELSQDGFDADVVDRAVGMIDRAEYKRRQAPPGVKLRPKAFGRDRRTPITNRWKS